MSCDQHERTSAFLDGELDAHESAQAERHIEACADCQALVAAAGDASEALRSPAARLTAPASLRARVLQGLDGQTAEVVRLRPARPGRGRFWLGAASGVGASAIAASLALMLLLPPSPPSLATEIADAHVQALMKGPLIQVASSSHHTVKPWFAGKAPLSPPVVDLAAEGFPLAGGRVARIAGQTAAVVVYRHGAHEIDLFAWPSRGAIPLAAERRGYHLVFWRSGDLSLAAVSDTQRSELDRFARLVQAERE